MLKLWCVFVALFAVLCEKREGDEILFWCYMLWGVCACAAALISFACGLVLLN
jgi:hypothetical protein